MTVLAKSGDGCDEENIPGPADDDSEADDSFHMGAERLEDDEELRLHILGVKNFFGKYWPYTCKIKP